MEAEAVVIRLRGILLVCAMISLSACVTSDKATLEDGIRESLDSGRVACESDSVDRAAVFALQASRFRLELNGYGETTATIKKAYFYKEMAALFHTSGLGNPQGNACYSIAANLNRLSSRYFTDAYWADDRLRPSLPGSDRDELEQLALNEIIASTRP